MSAWKHTGGRSVFATWLVGVAGQDLRQGQRVRVRAPRLPVLSSTIASKRRRSPLESNGRIDHGTRLIARGKGEIVSPRSNTLRPVLLLVVATVLGCRSSDSDLAAAASDLRDAASRLQAVADRLDRREGVSHAEFDVQKARDQLRPPSATAAEIASSPQALVVHVIDVGQADAILIQCPDREHELLIDAADSRYPGSSKQFRAYLSALQVATNPIEVVVASHPHADHIGSMEWVVRRYPIELYVDNGEKHDTATFNRLEAALADQEVARWSPAVGEDWSIDFCSRDDVSAQVIFFKDFGGHENPNDNSLLVRVDYHDTSFLFVGDSEKAEERVVLADPAAKALLDVDFLKAGHHGSNTSSTVDFLQAVSPKVIAVSCGKRDTGTNKRYKHPRAETLAAFLGVAGPRQGSAVEVEAFDSTARTWGVVSLDRAVYVTTAEGSLVFESDGKKITRR